MGLDITNLVRIKTDDQGRMDISDLRKSLDKCSIENKKIFAIVATLGTTVRGAIDPIKEISEICKQRKIWLHRKKNANRQVSRECNETSRWRYRATICNKRVDIQRKFSRQRTMHNYVSEQKEKRTLSCRNRQRSNEQERKNEVRDKQIHRSKGGTVL